VRVIAVGPRLRLYIRGRRRIGPPIVFGLGVLRHLAARGARYDVVHTASFPYFSLLAAGLVRRHRRFRLVVDWHEVWTDDYWHEYLGAAGVAGIWIQRLCLRLRQEAFCFSRLHAERLEREGVNGPVTVLRGQYEGGPGPEDAAETRPVVVYAGRHIPEKRVTAIVPALIEVRKQAPEVRAAIFGDGPDRPAVLRQIDEADLDHAAEAPGFVEQSVVEDALQSALCLVLPSRREGYGLVVVEGTARGTPAVVVAGPDNAAVEFIEEGLNGFVAASASPADLAGAILRVYQAGPALRQSTAGWFSRNSASLSLAASLDVVSRAYAGERAES
jgi:glycosyltransferase involved in cell wall biosynthesis